MAGMESLGRLDNVIPIAAGAGFKFRSASCIEVVCTGNDTFTVNQATSFAGVYTALPCIKNVYWATATNGTAAWNKFTWVNGTALLSAITLNNAGAGTPASMVNAAVGVFHIFTSILSDPNNYIKVTAAAAGLVQIRLMDLVHQRAPANMEILGS